MDAKAVAAALSDLDAGREERLPFVHRTRAHSA